MKRRHVTKAKKRKTVIKRLRLKGDTSPLLLIVILLAGIFTLGILAATRGNDNQSRLTAPATTHTGTAGAQLKMETFYVTPVPEITPLPMKSCSASVSDTMLVFDRSGSMNESGKITKAKQAAVDFVNMVSANSQSRVGLTLFSDSSSLASSLTNNITALNSAINSITARGFTCIQCGIYTANLDIAINKRAGVKQNVIILTDGKANRVIGTQGETENNQAKQAAKEEALKGFAESGIAYHTIGFGDVDTDLLREIAAATGGTSFISPDANQLGQFFTLITQRICQ